jgi:thiamine pyrophosphate-dependent acetolactate synthase large subunit-like protein
MADLFEADLSSVRFRTTEIAARLGSHDRAGEFEDASDDRGGDLRAYALAFDDILPTDRIVAVDVGHFTSEIVRYVSVTRPDRLVFAVNFGSVGLGLATGLGAALAGTDSPVFAFVGDGGLMMSIQELETAARAQIPLTVIVMNDGGYGAEVHKLRSLGYGGELARFDNPDLVALAGVLGADALRVTSVQQLRESRDHLAATNGPLLVDVQLNPDVRTDWYGEQLERKAVTPST